MLEPEGAFHDSFAHCFEIGVADSHEQRVCSERGLGGGASGDLCRILV